LGTYIATERSTVILHKAIADKLVALKHNKRRYTLNAELICYCFGCTVADIKVDAIRNGRSTILERIIREKHDGACRCAETNPTGR
jgi:hypothetical protein